MDSHIRLGPVHYTLAAVVREQSTVCVNVRQVDLGQGVRTAPGDSIQDCLAHLFLEEWVAKPLSCRVLIFEMLVPCKTDAVVELSA